MAGSSDLVGLVVPDVRNPFFVDIARAAEERAARAGLRVVLLDSHERADLEAQHLEALDSQGVRGVLIAPVGDHPPQLVRMHDAGTPVVLVDRPAGGGFSSVAVDDAIGGRVAAEHLLAGGRRRLLFVGGPLGRPQLKSRLDGARAAVSEVEGARIHVLPVAHPTVRDGVAAGQDLLAFGRRIDAVLAANDLLALGVLQALSVPGAPRVPEDIALVGNDDIDLVASAVVPITSVSRRRSQLGAAAIELLLEEAAGAPTGRAVVLRPELVARASTA